MQKKCFVVMSFDKELDGVYTGPIKDAAAHHGFICERADAWQKSDDIPDSIIKSLISADVVVVDLTHPKPNVYFELGIAFSIQKPTICISQTTQLPFDVRNYRIIKYDPDHLDELRLKLREVLYNVDEFRANPVTNSGREHFDLRAKIELNLQSINKDRIRAEEFANFAKYSHADNQLVAQELIDEIVRRSRLRRNQPTLIALSGAGSIGKSTFSKVLRDQWKKKFPKLSVDILPTDAYMGDRASRIAKSITGFDIRAHNLAAFEQDVHSLIKGHDVKVRPYNHATGKHDGEKVIRGSDLVILEGIHSCHPPIAKHIDYSVFIYSTKFIVKELKFLADFMFRSYTPAAAFEHSEREYMDYEEHVLPYWKQADTVIFVDGFWRYRLNRVEGKYSKNASLPT